VHRSSRGGDLRRDVEPEAEQQSRSEYTTAAELSAASVSEWLDERTNNARMLAQYDVLVGGNYTRVQSFLAEELARMPADVRNVHYVNFQSQESIASTDPGCADSG